MHSALDYTPSTLAIQKILSSPKSICLMFDQVHKKVNNNFDIKLAIKKLCFYDASLIW